MKSRKNDLFSLTRRHAVVWGTASALLFSFVMGASAQQMNPPRQNEYMASASGGEQSNSFLYSMKQMRQRAETRYKQNMQQFNEQIQRYNQQQEAKKYNQQQKQGQQAAQKSGYGSAQQNPFAASGQYAQQGHNNHQQNQNGSSQNPFAAIQQFFGLQNSGSQNASAQKPSSRPGYPQPNGQQAAYPTQGVPLQHNHPTGPNQQMTPQQQQQALLASAAA